MNAYPPSMRHVLLDDPRQMLLDDVLIADSSGVIRRIGTVEKFDGNPVLTPTEPHEQMGVMMFGTLVFDEGRYRCWYYTSGEGTHFCYAESQDGLVWMKPALEQVSWRGSRANNILFTAPESWTIANVSVSKSTAETNPNHRYRAVLFMYRNDEPRGPTRGHYLIYSSDGIDWTQPASEPNVRCNECGGLLWDESRRDYIDLNKTGHGLEMFNREDMRVGHTRCTTVAASDDGDIWSPYRVVLSPNLYLDEPYDEFYHLHGFRWGGSYVGYLRVYHNTPDNGPAPRQRIDIQLATSRDGEVWQRVCPGENFISSAEPRQWDFGRIAIGNAPPIIVGDEMRLYYCGQPTDHRGGDGFGGKGENGLGKGYTAKVGFATLRKDGFVSLDADDEGELLTHPVSSRQRLELNINAIDGFCRVELRDSNGKPLPGYTVEDCIPITHDSVTCKVVWKHKQELPRSDDRIRLRIIMHCAKLYSWTIL